jgi:hypothetical protein
MRGLAVLGILLTFVFFGAALLNETEWRDSGFATARYACGVAAVGIAFVLLLLEPALDRRTEASRRLQRATALESHRDLWRHRDLADDLKKQAIDGLVHEHPFHGADLLHLLARHQLVDQAEVDRLIDDARRRADAEQVDAFAPAASQTDRPAFARAVDDEIPF